MSPTLRLWLGTIAATALSLLAAFFVVFNMVFSDVFGVSERIGSYVYAGVAYFVLGFICGLAGPTHLRRWEYILATPAILILVLYTFSEPQNWLIHFGFALLVPLAAHAGVLAGGRLRKPKATA